MCDEGRMSVERGDTEEQGQVEGRYANYLQVGHNAVEFVFDFGQYFPNSEQPYLHTRIVTSPVYARAFLQTLRGSIAQYEDQFGVIDEA
jgi:hypothetical protein